MNTKRVKAAEGVILAAMKNRVTAAGVAVALESACLLQSPEVAAEQVEQRKTLEQRTHLLREVQKMARQRGLEAKGRKAYGDRLKSENARLLAELHGARKEIRAIQSWITENTPYSGRVPGQVLRTLVWLRETGDMYRSWCHDDQIKGRERLRELIAADGESDRLRVALKSARRGRGKLRARVAELEAERHSTNESLSDAAEAMRVQRDRIAELEATLAKYVGVEPTVAEELAYVSRCLHAVYDVCDAAEKQAIRWEQPLPVPDWVALVRNAADGVMDAAPALPPAPRRQQEDPHDGPLASRYAIPHDLPTTPTAGSAL